MPHRTTAFAHVALLLLAALISALVLSGSELRMPTAGEHSDVVWITENPRGTEAADVAPTLTRVAAEQGAAIGYTFPDVDEPDTLWHMYLALGAPDSPRADWLTDGFPTFGRTMELSVHPLEEYTGTSPRGYYTLFGPPESERALEEALAEHGLSQAPGATESDQWFLLTGGALSNTLAAALLVVVTSASVGVLLDSRDYAVQRLQGRSYARILMRDLVRIARLWAVALPAAATAVLVVLGLYNGWNQLDSYALTTATLLIPLLAAALATHAATLGAVHLTAVLPALKGRIPVRTVNTAVYLVRVPVLLLVLGVLGAVVHHTATVREQQAGLELFARTEDTSFVTVNGSVSLDEHGTMDERLGPWLRRVDSDGGLILSDQVPPESVLPLGSDRPGFDLLVVNDTYLEAEELLSPSGERYGAAPSGGPVRALVPERHSGFSEDIASAAPAWVGALSGGEGIEVEALPLADGQSVFTYGSRPPAPGTSPPLLHDPVVLVLPNGAVLSDTSYVGAASRAALLFPDPGIVERARRDPATAEYINTVPTVESRAVADHAATLTTLRTEAFNLVAAIAVLLLTGVAACVIHVRTRAQGIFTRHISGWSFAAVHRWFLALEAAIALGFVGWAAWTTASTLRALRDPTVLPLPAYIPTSGLEPLHALGITAAGLALTLGALTVFHRRIVREGASQS
ncbi:hypothetical protein [Nocardiopsis sp. LOL_012]|uniref:hypothetical protein n=1 Tax=Nocardiopsis sp. LOL_012 TaxID=3345409 RepID=UPI003A8B9567